MSDPADPLSPSLGAVVLAAGQGTRMRSRLPKVLHPLVGQPMVTHVLDALAAAGVNDVVLVVGHGANQVRAALGDRVRYAEQREQLGTGHAVQQALPLLAPTVNRVLVLYGDSPLLTPDTLRALQTASDEAHPAPPRLGGREGTVAGAPVGPSGGPPLALLTMIVPDPTSYGRVVRADGRVVGLVEERDATAEQRKIREVNVGTYVFDAAWLREHLPTLQPSASGEYYLTDLVERAAAERCPLAAVRLASWLEGLGVNDRTQLALAESLLRQRIAKRLMLSGVTLLDPATTYVDGTVEIGPDTVVHPGTYLRGRTRIGADCEIGPATEIHDSEVGDRCRVWRSVLDGATLAADVQVGPFSHLRPGARLASGVQIGNYAEVKNSVLHEDVQQHHFSYIGDAEVGRNTNVGAGTITCNYDGENKHRTEIGEDVFLGSDTLLVAPVRMGDGSGTGAGAVVTRDVEAGMLVKGVPAKPFRDRTAPARNGAGAGDQRSANGAPTVDSPSLIPAEEGA
jgi:bifunctional UDP-N-acetylglucosamine pyrophosphorylase/glucosamine-1-phosphate N-acetyltransferase